MPRALVLQPRMLTTALMLSLAGLTLPACQRSSEPSSEAQQKSPLLPTPPSQSSHDAPPSPAAPSAATTASSAPTDATAAPKTELPDGPRIYAKTRNVWIREFPSSRTQWVGFLWFGGSVALKSEKSVAGPGCDNWLPVEPRGYVCNDGERATTDRDDPVLQGILPYAPRLDTPWPHEYAETEHGTPRYRELPARELQEARERDLARHLQRVAQAKAAGKASPNSPSLELVAVRDSAVTLPPLPRTLQMGRDKLRRQSTIAYAATTKVEGRSWLLSADLTWIPQDRVRLFPKVTFQGVHLDDDTALPLAFFREADRPHYRQTKQGDFEPADGHFGRLSHVRLTGEETLRGGELYLHTTDPAVFVKRGDAVVVRPRQKTPWGAPVLGIDETGQAPEGRQTWLEVSILEGYLIAYEGTRPVFTTLIAPGRGGPPVGDRDPIETASTPTGFFKITGKFATSTMVAPNELVHSDVPWAQNFTAKHALHAAYWHNDWGQLKSGGCVNLSPIDAKWLFDFTEPRVPTGWHGVRWLPKQEAATMLIINRR